MIDADARIRSVLDADYRRVVITWDRAMMPENLAGMVPEGCGLVTAVARESHPAKGPVTVSSVVPALPWRHDVADELRQVMNETVAMTMKSAD